MKAYSTHGNWSTLERIRELEKGRENSFPDPPYDFNGGLSSTEPQVKLST